MIDSSLLNMLCYIRSRDNYFLDDICVTVNFMQFNSNAFAMIKFSLIYWSLLILLFCLVYSTLNVYVLEINWFQICHFDLLYFTNVFHCLPRVNSI